MSETLLADREVELKFDVTEDQLERLRNKSILKELSSGGPTHRMLRSIYYDTSNRLLKSSGISLRIRRIGDRWVQTLKASGGVIAGLSKPLELEWPVSKSQPDIERLEQTEAAEQFKELLRDADLKPIFETIVSRTTNQVRAKDGSHIEIAFDKGKVQAGKTSNDINEVEIELKSGHPSSLFGVAEEMAAGEALRFSTMSKAERGYRVIDGEITEIPKARWYQQPSLAKKCAAEDAFRELLGTCADQAAHNWKVILDTSDIEGPHQLRVGLRRLRSAIKAFRPILSGKQVRGIELEARSIARLVGELRDVDVLADEMVTSAIETFPDDVALIELQKQLNVERVRVRNKVVDELSGDRMVLFLLRLGQVIEAPKWRSKQGKPNKLLAAHIAAPALERSWSRAAKWGANIENLSVAERHSMRKSLKLVRYQVEAFEGFYPKRRTKPFLKKLKGLQDIFGYLNDVAMAEKLAHMEFAADLNRTEIQMAIGSVLGWHTAQADRAWRKAHRSWRSLEKSARFWAT